MPKDRRLLYAVQRTRPTGRGLEIGKKIDYWVGVAAVAQG